MNNISQERAPAGQTKWQMSFLALISLLVGSGVLWLAWLRYQAIVNAPDANWYPWIQLMALGLAGVLCVIASILSFLGRQSGLPVFKTGLSIIPLLLFLNLIVLAFRVILTVMQGNAEFSFGRVFTRPHEILIIFIIVILLMWLDSLGERDKNRE